MPLRVRLQITPLTPCTVAYVLIAQRSFRVLFAVRSTTVDGCLGLGDLDCGECGFYISLVRPDAGR